MSIGTDIAAVTAAIAIVSDANTKAALTAIAFALTDINNSTITKPALNAVAGVNASATATYAGGNYDVLSGVPHVSQASVPSRVSAASTVNNASLNISTTSLAAGVHTVAYNATLAAVGGSGAGYVWTGQSLPSGLALSSGGLLSGTLAAGTYSLIVTVSDSAGNSVSAAFGLVIA